MGEPIIIQWSGRNSEKRKLFVQKAHKYPNESIFLAIPLLQNYSNYKEFLKSNLYYLSLQT